MWARTATLLKSVVSFVLIVTSHALAYKLADYRVF
jgi:ABC-type polysaccharide transport system permease subunit